MRRNRTGRRGLAALLLLFVLVVSCTSPTPTPTALLPARTTPATVASSGESSDRVSTSAAASSPSVSPPGSAPPSSVTEPDPALTSVSLNAAVNGQSVTAQTTISSAPGLTFDMVGVCARNSAGDVVDFPMQVSAAISAGGTDFSATQTLQPGTYVYWACALLGERWHDIGARKTVVVPAAVGLSGQAMPVGNLPGWTQIFTDDFTTDVPMGGFPGPYANKWTGYDGFPDTAGDGEYAQRILSVHHGVLDMFLHSENGTPLGAAPVPSIGDVQWGGQVYGRYVIRFKSDHLPGYGTGWLLWPNSGQWNDGEIDFPEGSLAGKIQGFNHCVGHAQDKCMRVDTPASFTQWHTATIEWRPDRLTFILDGKVVGTTTKDIPTTPMRWTLQTATNGPTPDPATAGHLLIDWVAIYALA